MKCPRCLASFTVKPAAAAGIDAGWDAPSAAPPPPPGSKYYLRRRTGKVFGPFLEKAIASMLEQSKLDGDEDLSLDGQSWQPLASIPALAPYARSKAPAGARGQAAGPDGGVDLPAPRGAIVPEVVDLPGLPGQRAPGVTDLPAPRGAVPPRPPAPPPPPAGVLQGFDHSPGGDLGEFDLGADDGAELPAPKGAIPPPPRPAAPPSPLQDLVDLPAPRGHGLADLPAPKGPPPSPPKPPAPTRATGTDYGMLDLGGDDVAELPVPKDDILDLPAPKTPGIVDLPAPKAPGVTDLLTPKGPGRAPPPPPPMGVVDLPAPKDGVTDLLAPRDGVTDLLEPREGLSGLPAPKGSGLEYGQIGELDDLPVSAGKSIGLDLDLPAPKEGGAAPLDAPDLLTPKADGSPLIVDVVAPKGRPVEEEGEGEGEALRFEAPRGVQVEVAEEVPVEIEEEPEVGTPKPRPRTALFVGGAIGGLILVAGLVLGLVTDYGFFGLGLITGSYDKTAKGKKQLVTAREAILKDTFAGYSQAASDFEGAGKNLAQPEPLAFAAQALAAAAHRFDPRKRVDAEAIVAKLQKQELKSPELDKARALVALAGGNPAEAVTLLKAVSDKEPADFTAAMYLGWAQLASDPAAAQASLNRALAANASLAGALFALAESYRAQKAPEKAEAYLDKTLAASPGHTSALLRKVEGHLRAHRTAQAQAALRQVMSFAPAPAEAGRAQSYLGDLAAAEGQNRQARELYQKALQIAPRTLNAYLGLGALNQQARRYDEALATYKQAQAIDPAELRVSLGMTTALLSLHKPVDARKALQEAARLAPQAPEVLYLQGEIEETVGNLAPAEQFYKETLKKNPTFFEAYRRLALIYSREKKHDEAVKLLAEANTKIPSSPLVRAAEGEVLYAAKKLEPAQAKLEEALRLDPNLNAASFLLASVLADLRKPEEAKARLLALKAKDGEYPSLAAKLGEVHVTLKEYEKASAEYQAALQRDPPISVRLAAARAFLLANKPEQALKESEKTLELEPNRHAARAIRAQARLAQGKTDEALIEINQAIERESTAEYQVILGQVQEARNQIADAIDAYTAALKADPSLTSIRLRRGVLLVKTGTVREGLKELQSVIKANPELAEAYFYMGQAHQDQQQEAQALAAYKTAVAKDPKLGEAHVKIAQIYNDTQRKAEALPHLEAAIKAASEGASWLPEAYFLHGTISLERGQKKAAIDSYTSFLKVAPARSALRPDVLRKLRNLGVDPASSK
jgi:tetratricopeptide (TPR) repeat protein